jgi:catechol 2,3-dioxygenase-like lactoylglutathione lyase family enzyme
MPHNPGLDEFQESTMIDHTGVAVSDFERSKAFYGAALGAIGYAKLLEMGPEITGSTSVAGFGEPPKPDFWIHAGTPNVPPIHVAFRVPTPALVRAFHAAALAAGGTDNGAPGLRPHYHAAYYGAFVRDPDGHNIEAVCHEAQEGSA